MLAIKLVVAAAVAVFGLTASVVEFSSWAEPDPAVEYVQGDPAWAHVDQAP